MKPTTVLTIGVFAIVALTFFCFNLGHDTVARDADHQYYIGGPSYPPFYKSSDPTWFIADMALGFGKTFIIGGITLIRILVAVGESFVLWLVCFAFKELWPKRQKQSAMGAIPPVPEPPRTS